MLVMWYNLINTMSLLITKTSNMATFLTPWLLLYTLFVILVYFPVFFVLNIYFFSDNYHAMGFNTGLVLWVRHRKPMHYNDVIMGATSSQITGTIVYLIVCSVANQREHQSPASLAFVWRIHRSPVYSPHKGPVTRKMFRFDDVIMVFVTGYKCVYCEKQETCVLSWW